MTVELQRTAGRLWSDRRFWTLVLLVVAVTVPSQAIGTFEIPVGETAITLFPFIYAIVIGAVVSWQRWRPVPVAMQRRGAILVAPVIAIFMARLGLLIGPGLDKLAGASAALLLQEVGHIFGSVLFSLPVAVVLLRLGRESIGATYSIDREPMLGIIVEEYGGESPEYRGALSTYVVGSLVGAVFSALLIGALASFGVFSPLALSLGSAVGSTSMMLGGVGALVSLFPDQKETIFTFSAAGNVVTGLSGTYAAAFIALPLVKRLYPFWRRVARRGSDAGAEAQAADVPDRADATERRASSESGDTPRPLSIVETAVVLLAFGVIVALSQLVTDWSLSWSVVPGIALLLAISWVAVVVNRYVSWLPYIVVTLAIATIISLPIFPGQAVILSAVEGVGLIPIGTPVLALVGLGLGKDVGSLLRSGWRLFVVALTVIAASIIGASAVAEFSLTYLGL